jgi:hypothetical protein
MGPARPHAASGPSLVGASVAVLVAALTFSFALDSLPGQASRVLFALSSVGGACAGAATAVPMARRRRGRPAGEPGPATLGVMAKAVAALCAAQLLRRAVPLSARDCVLALACTFAVACVVLSAVLVRRTDASGGRPRRQPAHRRARVRAIPVTAHVAAVPAMVRAPELAAVVPPPPTPTFDPERVSAAIVMWTGKGGRKPFSGGGDGRVVERFGPDATDALLPEVRRLLDEFLAIPADGGCTNWQAADAAAEQFRARYPSLSPPAVEALRWCYAHEVARD